MPTHYTLSFSALPWPEMVMPVIVSVPPLMWMLASPLPPNLLTGIANSSVVSLNQLCPCHCPESVSLLSMPRCILSPLPPLSVSAFLCLSLSSPLLKFSPFFIYTSFDTFRDCHCWQYFGVETLSACVPPTYLLGVLFDWLQCLTCKPESRSPACSTWTLCDCRIQVAPK